MRRSTRAVWLLPTSKRPLISPDFGKLLGDSQAVRFPVELWVWPWSWFEIFTEETHVRKCSVLSESGITWWLVDDNSCCSAAVCAVWVFKTAIWDPEVLRGQVPVPLALKGIKTRLSLVLTSSLPAFTSPRCKSDSCTSIVNYWLFACFPKMVVKFSLYRLWLGKSVIKISKGYKQELRWRLTSTMEDLYFSNDYFSNHSSAAGTIICRGKTARLLEISK